MNITVALTRRQRTRGLLGHAPLAPDEALLIPRCRSVHTIGMAFPIDVAYLDGSGLVLEVVTMMPGILGRPRLRARHVLECAAGHAPAVGRVVHEIHEGPTEPVTVHSPFTNSTTDVPPDAHRPPQ